MTLAELSLRRPVMATVAGILIVVLGLAALSRLSVRELPDIDAAQITVSVSYTGAAPEVMDAQVTSVIEGAIAGIAGLRTISSNADRGSSRTVLTFESSRDIDEAANDVRSAIDGIVGDLPEEADPPQIEKSDSQGDPVLRLSLTSTEMDAVELTDYANRFVVDRLARLEGVASIQINGERAPAMRIWLDVARMAAHDIAIEDVTDALANNNIELPAGEIETPGRQIQLLARTRFSELAEFENLTLRYDNGHRIILSDVARVEAGTESDESLSRTNGDQTVGLAVLAQAQANTIAISDAVRQEVDLVASQLPPGAALWVNSDEAIFIERTIEQVARVLVEAMVLVVAVIFVFLGSLRASLVPAVTIPISLLGAVIGMLIMGFTINVLSLFALILAIGLVVDDAIVVLENIQRRMALGETAIQASLLGTIQVNFAVIATTAVLIAVFVPISFMEGEVGGLFAEFGIVLALSITLSSFVALSLCPVLAARLLHGDGKTGRFQRIVDRCLERLNGAYRFALERALRWPAVVTGLCLLLTAGGAGLYERLAQELAPAEDRGSVLVSITAPQGSNLPYTDGVARQVEAVLQPYRENGPVENIITVVGRWGDLHRAIVFLRLAEWSERDVTQQQLLALIRPELDRIGGANIRAFGQSGIGGGGSGGLEVIVGGPDIASAVEWSALMEDRMRANLGFQSLEIGYSPNQPGAVIEVDRERARNLGIDASDVAQTLQVLFASRSLTEYTDRGRQYPVYLRAQAEDRDNVTDPLATLVRAGSSELVPLSGFVELTEEANAPSLLRHDRMPSVEISADLANGYDLGEAIAFVQEVANDLPTGSTLAFEGEARDFIETSGGMYLIFGFAFVIVFLVLAAQFESFVDPVIIVLTVPLAAAGAIFTLWGTGQSVNIYTQVGLLLIAGLVVKNSILIVEFANQMREEGMAVREAVVEASVTRLRPILMTSVATLAGAVPLITASGAGAESRRAIGTVIVGGFSFAAVLTLFLTPVLYDALCRFKGTRDAAGREVDRAISQARDRQ